MTKVLLLGASGQIGNFLYKKLQGNATIEVLGTSRKGANEYLKFDPFKNDWKALGKMDVLINCVGQIQETKGADFAKIHLGLTKIILKNREIIGNPRIIQISALGASTAHPVVFLQTKGQADEILLEEENTFIIRPSIVCTPETMLVRKLKMLSRIARLTNNFLFVPKGFLNHKIQPILIDDLCQLIENLSLGGRSARTINAVGPMDISYHQLINIVEKGRTKNFKIKEINKEVVGVLVKNIISPLFPGLINYQQYQLLFSDNVASLNDTERILDRKPASTMGFWEKELSH